MAARELCVDPLELEQEDAGEVAREARRLALELRLPLIDLLRADHTGLSLRASDDLYTPSCDRVDVPNR
jgi:hypothetical protein